jgi:hypothetical protein
MNIPLIYSLWMMYCFFFNGTEVESRKMQEILLLYHKATSMEVNYLKYVIYFNSPSDVDEQHSKALFSFRNLKLQDGLKYLGFTLKPNGYGKNDWTWLLSNI